MKKVIIGIVTGAVILGGATFVAADSYGDKFFNFDEMKPHMEKMHPDYSSEQLEQMFNACHGEND